MIETKDITKMVAHIVRRDKGIADPQLMHPAREWFTGLTITTVFVLLGTWFCFYMYTQYTQTISTELSVSELAVPYQAEQIADAIAIYEARQLKLSEILEEVSGEGSRVVGTTTLALPAEVSPVSVSVDPVTVPVEEPPVIEEEEFPAAILAP